MQKAAEDLSQHVLGIDHPRQPAERVRCPPQVFGAELSGIRPLGKRGL